MTKKFIILIFCFSFCQPLFSSPKISLSKPFWEIGLVSTAEPLEQNLTVYNDGDEPLVLSLRTSCPCLEIIPKTAEISRDNSLTFKISYFPEPPNGNKTYYIFIDSNDPKNENISWLIEASLKLKQLSKSNHNDDRLYVPHDSGNQLTVEVYFTRGCSYCKELLGNVLPNASKNTGIGINAVKLPVPDNYRRLIEAESRIGTKVTNFPAVIVGNEILAGKDDIEGRIESLLIKNQGFKANTTVSTKEFEIKLLERLQNLNIFALLAAGLIDGLNPCAFSGIIFLAAYLGIVKKRKTSDVLYTGILFILGVYLMYFFIGVGLYKVISYIETLELVSKAVYFSMGLLLIILSILSFVDYYRISKHNSEKPLNVTLALPKSVKKYMHRLIEIAARTKFVIPIGFLLGIVISFLEFFCTGQIYLPSIMYMAKIPVLRTKSIVLLLLYGFMFILPLIIVFIGMLLTLKSGRIQAFSKSHSKFVKIINGFIFLILGILMFFF